jgi:hypothetical protein
VDTTFLELRILRTKAKELREACENAASSIAAGNPSEARGILEKALIACVADDLFDKPRDTSTLAQARGYLD